MDFEIVWNGWPHPEFEDLIRKEVAELMDDGLSRTDNLITHLIEVGDNIEDGPLIEITGIHGKVHAEYIADPKWVTLDGATQPS